MLLRHCNTINIKCKICQLLLVYYGRKNVTILFLMFYIYNIATTSNMDYDSLLVTFWAWTFISFLVETLTLQ